MFYMGYNAKRVFLRVLRFPSNFSFFVWTNSLLMFFDMNNINRQKKTKKSDHVLEPSVVIGLNSQFAHQIIRASVFRTHSIKPSKYMFKTVCLYSSSCTSISFGTTCIMSSVMMKTKSTSRVIQTNGQV